MTILPSKKTSPLAEQTLSQFCLITMYCITVAKMQCIRSNVCDSEFLTICVNFSDSIEQPGTYLFCRLAACICFYHSKRLIHWFLTFKTVVNSEIKWFLHMGRNSYSQSTLDNKLSGKVFTSVCCRRTFVK